MKLKIVIDPDREEEVVVFTHARTPLVEEIERLLSDKPLELVGFQDGEATALEYVKVTRFTV